MKQDCIKTTQLDIVTFAQNSGARSGVISEFEDNLVYRDFQVKQGYSERSFLKRGVGEWGRR